MRGSLATVSLLHRTELSSRAKRGICCSLALTADRRSGVASAARLLLLLSPRGAGARAPRARLQIGLAASKASSLLRHRWPATATILSGAGVRVAERDAGVKQNRV